MKFLDEIENLLTTNSSPGYDELQELRKTLLTTLDRINEKLGVSQKKAFSIENCPHCKSSNIKEHDQKFHRMYCLDCDHAYAKFRSPLYYRKRNRMKIVNFIMLIYQTKKVNMKSLMNLKSTLKHIHNGKMMSRLSYLN